MKQIDLIRHGMTAGNLKKRYIGSTDEPLCEIGRENLNQIKYPEADHLFLSPLQRCIQTAELLYPKQYAKGDITIVQDFRECAFGLFENKNYLELKDCRAYQDWIDSNGTLPFPGGEAVEEFKERCCLAFERVLLLLLSQDWEHIALVVHGGTIMSIMERYAVPHQEYYHWHTGNGKGYRIKVQETIWQTRHQLWDIKILP